MKLDSENGKKTFSQILLVAIVILIITDLVVVGVLVTLWTSSGKVLSEVKTQLAYIQDTNSIIQNEVTNMESNIEATLEAESSMLENYSIEVTGYDFAAGTYDVAISILPKEYTDTTQAVIYFGTEQSNLALNGLVYEGTATLPVGTAYDGNVTVLFMDGNKKTTEVLQRYKGFQSSVEGLLGGEIEQNPTYENGMLALSTNMNYILEGNSNYEFETFEFIITAGGEELYYYDLLETQEHYSGEYLIDLEDAESRGHMNPEGGDTSLDNNPESSSVQTAGALDSDMPDTAGENAAGSGIQDADTDGSDVEQDNVGNSALSSDTTTDGRLEITGEGNAENVDTENEGIDNGNAEGVDTEFIRRATVHPAVRSMSGEIPVNIHCQVEQSQKMHVFLRAITTTGLIVEYDLFNGYTRSNGSDFQYSANYNAGNYILYDNKGGRWIP